jgi:hypothetical protein
LETAKPLIKPILSENLYFPDVPATNDLACGPQRNSPVRIFDKLLDQCGCRVQKRSAIT